MAHTFDQRSPISGGFGASQAVAPAWAATREVTPIRSPSRSRPEYRSRGHVSETAITIWGTPEVTKRRQPPETSPKRRKRLTYAAVPIVGAGVMIASFGVFGPSASTPPSLVKTEIATLAPPATAVTPAVSIDLANNAPVIGSADRLVLPEQTAPQTFVTRGPQQNPPIVDAATPALADPAVAPTTPVAISTVQAAPTRLSAPIQITNTSSSDPFVCSDCVSVAPAFDDIAITVFTSGMDPSAQLTTFAPKDISITQAQIASTENQVRYYRANDAAKAAFLATRYNAKLVDLSWFAPDTSARIDLLLAPDN